MVNSSSTAAGEVPVLKEICPTGKHRASRCLIILVKMLTDNCWTFHCRVRSKGRLTADICSELPSQASICALNQAIEKPTAGH